MTTTASTTVVDRTSRVRDAAASMAMVYLRLLADGDHARASVVLAEFQRFWTTYHRDIVPTPPPFDGIPPDLRASGMLDQPTQNAVVTSLYLGRLVPYSMATSFSGGARALLTQVYPTIPAIGAGTVAALALEAANRGPVQDAGVSVSTWAFGFIEGLDEEANLMDTLSRGEVTVPPVHEFGDEYVFAQPLQPKAAVLWPWAVVAVGGVLLYAGFVYKKKGRRRR